MRRWKACKCCLNEVAVDTGVWRKEGPGGSLGRSDACISLSLSFFGKLGADARERGGFWVRNDVTAATAAKPAPSEGAVE